MFDKSIRFGENVRIGKNVKIGANSYIDHDVIIRDNVTIGKNAFIGARSIIGEYQVDFIADRTEHPHPLVIGDNAVIRSETIIYGDCTIGDHFQTGHRVTIREQSKIGSHVRVGTLSDIQGHCEISDYVNMHSNVHIGQHSVIHKYVWLFPYVVLTNDPMPPSEIMEGVTVEEFAIVATRSVILPGIVIGKDSLVGAGSVVTKNVPAEAVVVGNPAKKVRNVRELKDSNGNSHYPWRYTFDRGMPWNGMDYDAWQISEE